MPELTEAMSRLTHAIGQMRRDRAKDAVSRHQEVKERSATVAASLLAAHTSRGSAVRVYQTAALATRTQRSKDIHAMTALFRRDRQVTRRHRFASAAVQHRQLAAFMTGLTASVDTLRDGFRADLASLRRTQRPKLATFRADLTRDVAVLRSRFDDAQNEQRKDLAAAARSVHDRLDHARQDRRGAFEAWHGLQPAVLARRGVDRPQRAEPVRTSEAAANDSRASVKDSAATTRPQAAAPKSATPAAAPTAVFTHAAKAPPTPQASAPAPDGSTATPKAGKPS